MDVNPIGWVRSTRLVPAGHGHGWNRETAAIELDGTAFDASALRGLDSFSHVEVVFLMDRVHVSTIERASRHPADRSDWPDVGIFAQRFSHRPNRLGITRCRIRSVQGLTLEVTGLDAIDGSPVLDLKPWMAEYGPHGDIVQPPWSHELMTGYWSPPDPVI